MRFDITVECIILQKYTQHPRHQHPSFPRARAGLDSDAAPWVAGNGVKLVTGNGLTVVFVGSRHHQKSLRHNPRAAQ